MLVDMLEPASGRGAGVSACAGRTNQFLSCWVQGVKYIGMWTQFCDPLKKKNWDEFTGGRFFKKIMVSRRA